MNHIGIEIQPLDMNQNNQYNLEIQKKEYESSSV
jgi:hypothetical protein